MTGSKFVVAWDGGWEDDCKGALGSSWDDENVLYPGGRSYTGVRIH